MHAAVQPWYGAPASFRRTCVAAHRLLPRARRLGGDRRAYGFHSQRSRSSPPPARGPRGRSSSSTTHASSARRLKPDVGAGAAAQAPRAHLPAARLAARDRLALPALRQGDARPRSSTASATFASSSTASPARSRREIVEEDGQIVMKKTCAKHGTLRGRDLHRPEVPRAHRAPLSRARLPGAARRTLREHGSSSIKYGRGSVLTVDLTNRCNMMCDPCFMDANQVGYVHELAWDEITEDPRRLADDPAAPPDERAVLRRRADAVAALPRRHPLRARDRLLRRAVRDQRAALRRRSRASPRQAKEAGLRMAYLQFDGVSNEANAHRKIGNLFDVKLRAIEELARRRHRRHPRRHRRQRRQQRSGRPDRRVRRSRTPTRSPSSSSSR